QTVYTMLGMQGLENVVCINSSGMADWTIAGFPVER
ncbi:MAG TPA: MBL fold metallo-hydrolase, partial [Deltaproteobacteria bacterium]|nr:MBL fold metallo-hydrolase [Deltaproteobacteria bacterium]